MGKKTNKKDKAIKCQEQFARTVQRTGKWRGKSPDKYVKYKKIKKGYDPDISWKFILSLHSKTEQAWLHKLKDSGKLTYWTNIKYGTKQNRTN